MLLPVVRGPLAVVVLLSGFGCSTAASQENAGFGGNRGISIEGSYAPTSQHILVGDAEGRETAQAGFGYTRKVKEWTNLKLMYEGILEPFYRESDPTIIGTSTPNAYGPPTVYIFPEPYRPS